MVIVRKDELGGEGSGHILFLTRNVGGRRRKRGGTLAIENMEEKKRIKILVENPSSEEGLISKRETAEPHLLNP